MEQGDEEAGKKKPRTEKTATGANLPVLDTTTDFGIRSERYAAVGTSGINGIFIFYTEEEELLVFFILFYVYGESARVAEHTLNRDQQAIDP